MRGTLNEAGDRDQAWTLEVAVPFDSFARPADRVPPRAGDTWRIQLNRWDGADSAEEDRNTWVDISELVEKKVNAYSKYLSQHGTGWPKYNGPNLCEAEDKAMKDLARRRIQKRNGRPVEGFRYYKGLPVSMGK